jgi:hypothetical protein
MAALAKALPCIQGCTHELRVGTGRCCLVLYEGMTLLLSQRHTNKWFDTSGIKFLPFGKLLVGESILSVVSAIEAFTAWVWNTCETTDSNEIENYLTDLHRKKIAKKSVNSIVSKSN